MDPEVNQRDVGGDPLEFARRRVQLSREAVRPPAGARAEAWRDTTSSPATSRAAAQLGLAFELAGKFVGGVVYRRDQAGSGRAPLTPVAADKQRSALKLISDNLFAADGFNIKPEFANRLVESAGTGLYTAAGSLTRRHPAWLWTATMDRLLSPRVAERLQNARNKVANGTPVLGLDGSTATSPAPSGDGVVVADTTPHVVHCSATRAGWRPSSPDPAFGTAAGDARALHRLTAKPCSPDAQQAKGNSKLGNQTRAHLDEIIDTLDAALKAQARVLSVSVPPRSCSRQ